MKKIYIVLIQLIMLSPLFAEERLSFSIENRNVQNSIYYADVMVTVNSTDYKWLSTASTIIIEYNTSGLGLNNLDGISVDNFDTELSSSGYSCNQTYFSPGLLAINLVTLNPNVNKSGSFKLCTVRWNVLSSTEYDNLEFDVIQSQIFNGTFSKLEYNCSTPSCYKVYNPSPKLLQAASMPTLTTTSISNITTNSANSGGNVSSDGGATVTSRGVCWSTSQNPTISNNISTNNGGTGSFTSSLTGLSSNTTYYVRAYATNSVGTAYGNQVSFTTTQNATIPTVTTSSTSNITSNSASSGGNVSSDGDSTVTSRGVCWSTSQNPTISNSKTTNNDGTGSFTSSITGLSANTTYYVKAYATNSIGTAYGNQVSFTTSQSATIPTVSSSNVTNITRNSASSGGNVTNDGGSTVTAKGVCWSTSQNPTIFNSKTNDGSGNGSFTSSITGLSSNTTYYLRAYATNAIGTAYGEQKTFLTEKNQTDTLYSVPENWDFDVTQNDALIICPTNINPKIGNRNLDSGDAIGVFYKVGNVLKCGGYKIWKNSNLDIVAWQDNDQTQEKDGFLTNELFILKIWDAKNGKEYLADVSFASGPNNFQVNGYSVLSKLNAILTETQLLTLNAGWNLISTYIKPNNDSIRVIWDTVITNLTMVKNGSGDNYIPDYDIDGIITWKYPEAYKVYMKSNDTLPIIGMELNPTNNLIILNSGWKLVSYLKSINKPITECLTTLTETNSLSIVKNNGGQVYIPAYNVNTIGNMLPGQGYQMYLTKLDTLIYPANSAGRAIINELTPMAKYVLPEFKVTGNSSVLLLEIEGNNGDEIAVYNQNNQVIGSGVIHKNKAAITIWGDDEKTREIDGAILGEKLKVKSYNLNTGRIIDVNLSDLVDVVTGNNIYELNYSKDAFFVAKAKVLDNNSNLSMLVNPNPACDYIEITIEGETDNTSLILFSNEGKQIADLTSELLTLSGNKLRYNSTNLTSGTYNLILNNGTYKIMKQIMIAK